MLVLWYNFNVESDSREEQLVLQLLLIIYGNATGSGGRGWGSREYRGREAKGRGSTYKFADAHCTCNKLLLHLPMAMHIYSNFLNFLVVLLKKFKETIDFFENCRIFLVLSLQGLFRV